MKLSKDFARAKATSNMTMHNILCHGPSQWGKNNFSNIALTTYIFNALGIT